MLLAMDIGNTNIHCGIFQGKKLIKSFRIEGCPKSGVSQLRKKIGRHACKIDKVIIVSVSPVKLRDAEMNLKKFLKAEISVVGRDLSAGVKNLYRKPSQVGGDRLVNARGANEILKKDAVIVDFGTAITIDVVTKKKEYLGGVIIPGVEISLNALSEKAALLPRVKLARPKGILGRETRHSMISGAVYGFSALCDGLVRELKTKYAEKAVVIATGGMSELIGAYCRTVQRIDPYLTLKGLRFIGGDKDV